ncbi:uncharacterized protein LOC122523190 [Polistes fuscatus]|uniref:uncharacterized protein LOC122523190 n=1 Tax=Polistes fuscatus TaxID=30207 RepID=UPI001CA8FF6A|nr:uncharacterized protein LOC122523190 [Polistes fuscatus]
MKYVFMIFATLVVAGVSAIPLNGDRSLSLNNLVNEVNDSEMKKNALVKDILDFIKLIPMDKVLPIMNRYENDSKLQASLHYAMSEEFHELVYSVEALPEHQKYVLYLQESGFDKIEELRMIHDVLGMEDYVPPSFLLLTISQYNLAESEGGLSGYIKELVETLPVKKIKELHNKKLKESAAFKKFSSYLLDEKFSQLYKDLAKTEAYKEFIQKSLEHGINYHAAQDLGLRVLGFRP